MSEWKISYEIWCKMILSWIPIGFNITNQTIFVGNVIEDSNPLKEFKGPLNQIGLNRYPSASIWTTSCTPFTSKVMSQLCPDTCIFRHIFSTSFDPYYLL
jgi:hypothetical protein